MRGAHWVLGVAAVLAGAGAARADVVYLHDDGSAEHLLGLQSAADLLWMSRYSELPGGPVIHTIEFTIGRDGPVYPQPSTVTLLVYEDPDDDGNPGDAVLLTAVTGVPVLYPNRTIFESVAIPPTTVSGEFFVGILATLSAGMFPVALDDFGLQGSTPLTYWYTGAPPGTLDPAAPPLFVDLTTGLYSNGVDSGQLAYALRFQIRAIANPEPSTLALFAAGVAGLGVLAVRRRRAVTSRG